MNKYHTIEFKEVVKALHTSYCIRFAIVDDPDPTQSDRFVYVCVIITSFSHGAHFNNMRPLNPEVSEVGTPGPKSATTFLGTLQHQGSLCLRNGSNKNNVALATFEKQAVFGARSDSRILVRDVQSRNTRWWF